VDSIGRKRGYDEQQGPDDELSIHHDRGGGKTDERDERPYLPLALFPPPVVAVNHLHEWQGVE